MEKLDLKKFTEILRRKKIIIICIILIFSILGVIYTFNFTKPMYKSTCTIILGMGSSLNDVMQEDMQVHNSDIISKSDLTVNSRFIETYIELAKSKSLLKDVINSLNIDLTQDEIINTIAVNRVKKSDLLGITAINRNPKIAKDIVKSVVNVFSEKVKEIYNINNVYIVDEPSIENIPYNINHDRDIFIFTLVGIFVSVGYVFIYNVMNNKVKESYDIENIINSRLLMTIPYNKNNRDEFIEVQNQKSKISEIFKILRTNVQFSTIKRKSCQTLLITSCLPGERKSYVASNLAITFAQAGKKVVLVDSDMRNGIQSKIFNIKNYNGLSNYISNLDSKGMDYNYDIKKIIKTTSINNLNIITSGNIPPNPSELLESEKVQELINNLKEMYDIVIFDGAPALIAQDFLALSRLLENTMLVAVYNKTKKENLVKAKISIENNGGKVIGIVINKITKVGSESAIIHYEKNILNKLNEIFKNIYRILVDKVKLENNNKNEESKSQEIKDTNTDVKKEKNISKVEDYKNKEEENVKNKRNIENKKIDDRKLEKVIKEELKEPKLDENNQQKSKMELQDKFENKEKINEEIRIRKEEEKNKKKEEINKIQAEKRREFKIKISKIKEKVLIKKDAIFEEIKSKKEKFIKNYKEFKEKRENINKIKKEKNEIRKQEIARIREEEKLKKEQERQRLLKEKEEKEKELARIAEEERLKREEQEKFLADERAKEEDILEEERKKQEEQEAIERARREAEIAIVREQERLKREEERKKREEEKAQKEAARIKREEELKIKKAEEKRKKEEEKAKLQEIKAAREQKLAKYRQEERLKKEEAKIKKAQEAKFTDEYLEENLYPKTKFNKF